MQKTEEQEERQLKRLLLLQKDREIQQKAQENQRLREEIAAERKRKRRGFRNDAPFPAEFVAQMKEYDTVNFDPPLEFHDLMVRRFEAAKFKKSERLGPNLHKLTLGFTTSRSNRVTSWSRDLRLNFNLWGPLRLLGRRLGIRFTSIDIVKNCPRAIHTDKGNVGTSKIVTFGNYAGGKFEVWPGRCLADGKPNENMPGSQVVDPHYLRSEGQGHEFDGKNWHSACERVSSSAAPPTPLHSGDDNLRQWQVPSSAIVEMKVLSREGTFGDVHLVQHRGMHMAFKTIRTGGSEAAQNQVKAALKEAYALKEAQHENLIRLEGVCIDDPQRLGVLMEYAEQGTLRQVLEANPEMGGKERRLLIRGILRGLAKLHSHKPTPILHGDLKGTNVLVMADGTPKLADFGQMSGASSGISMSMSMSKTHRGGGTPIYSAPELFADIFADSSDSEDDDCTAIYTMACDVYSGGVLMCEVLSGQQPWQKEIGEWAQKSLGFDKVKRKLARLVLKKGKRPALPENCHPLIRSITERCWHQEPEQRPPVQVVLDELETEIDAAADHETPGVRGEVLPNRYTVVYYSKEKHLPKLDDEQSPPSAEAIAIEVRRDAVFSHDILKNYEKSKKRPIASITPPMRVSSSDRVFKCSQCQHIQKMMRWRKTCEQCGAKILTKDTQETNKHKGQQKRSHKYTIPTTFVNQLLSQNAIIQINQTNPKRGKCAENYDR
jgi:serine/threonine protein kinase